MSRGPLPLSTARTHCSFCPKLCRHACPTALAEGTEQATPTAKQQVALRLGEGEDVGAEQAGWLYKCTDCAATVPACRHRIPVHTSLRAARADAVRRDLAPPPVSWLANRFRAHGSPYARDLSALLGEQLGEQRPRAPLAYFPACTAVVHEPAEVRAGAALLPDATPFLPEPGCCGYPLLAAGLEDAFRDHAARVAPHFGGFGEVVVGGPACAETLLRDYPAHGVQLLPRITPLAQALAARARCWPTPSAPPAPYAYHDPCFLARRLELTEGPREALTAALGAPPLDLPEARERTPCSGGGGVYPLTNPLGARGCAERVIALLRETGAERLVTGCPSAARRIRAVGSPLPEQALQVETLAVALARSVLRSP